MWSKEDMEYFDRHVGKVSCTKMAAHLGKSTAVVYAWGNRLGLSLRVAHHGNEKYSDSQVNEAKRMLAGGVAYKLIAQRTGLTCNYIAQLKAGRFRNKRRHNAGGKPSDLWRAALGQGR